MLWFLLSDQRCGAQGTGERQPSRYPQHRAIARDECTLDSLPATSISRLGGRESGPLGLDLCTRRGRQIETVQTSFQSALENSAE
jgi:hypothetical protein